MKHFVNPFLCVFFLAPNSFTSENMCELHIHGGVAVVKSVLSALMKMPHFRLAEPGEFTKRFVVFYFLKNGCIMDFFYI